MATSRKLIGLIQKDIDGQLSDRESAALARRLAEDPQAAAVHDGLKRLSHELSGQPSEPPPPTLRPAIMRAIEQRENQSLGRPVTQAARRALDPLFGSWRPAHAFAIGTVAGIALMLVTVFMVWPSSVSESGLTGTMARTMEKPLFSRVADVQFAGADTRGVITTERSGAFSVVTVSLNTAGDVVAALAFGDDSVRLAGVRPTEGRIDDVQVVDNTVSVRAVGRAVFEVLLVTGGSSHRPALFTVRRDGDELCSAEVPLQPDRR